MRWTSILHHCATQTQCHEHPQGTFDGVSGGPYVAPEHEYPAHIEVRLVVTDSRGLTDAKSVRLDPRTAECPRSSPPAQRAWS